MPKDVPLEDWVHKPTPVRAIEFTGFGRTGNGPVILDWLRSLNIGCDRVGDKIVFDNGTDDLPIKAAPGDWFVLGDEDAVYRVKAHMWAGLYERRTQ
jgi:hypothetical protein